MMIWHKQKRVSPSLVPIHHTRDNCSEISTCTDQQQDNRQQTLEIEYGRLRKKYNELKVINMNLTNNTIKFS